MFTHSTRVRVRYAETDQMGIVYHANYLIWMEVGRVEFCRARGLPYGKMEESSGLRLAVVEANCRYISPARFDDEVEIETSMAKASRRAVEFSYQLRNAESGRRLAEGVTRHLFLDASLKPAQLPERYYSFFGLG